MQVPVTQRRQLSRIMNQLKHINETVLSVLGGGDILLIVPPFVTSRTPILGPHILQSIARDLGYKTDILYVNLLLSSIIGIDDYESISYGQPFRLLGERLFARSAYGLPPLGKSPESCFEPKKSVFGDDGDDSVGEFEYKYYGPSDFDLPGFVALEALCTSFIEEVCGAIGSLDYKIVGCSTNWEQNNCCIALLEKLKRAQPGIITLMGGSNCEAEMAEGIGSLSQAIDVIFSGESETIFSDFLKGFSRGDLPTQRIIRGQPAADLDNIPLPDYDAFFKQIDCFFRGDPPKHLQVGYETSRGCWWGQCFFCGMNGKRGLFRQKSVKKVVGELEEINARYPENRILIIDKVMPTSFQKELLPLLCEKENASPITFEQRPDLSLHELMDLEKAGVNVIKPGIESFSTALLKLMNKGVDAGQNILLLRNARSLGMLVSWNLLWGFPGDLAVYYEETLNLLPLIGHLQPPVVFRHLSLDRFSRYFEQPEDFKIQTLRPWAVYNMVYPEWAEVEKLAYRFTGDYHSGAHDHPELIREIAGRVEYWDKTWKRTKLDMVPVAGGYIVRDTRGIEGNKESHILDRNRVKEIMTYGSYEDSENQRWALEEKLGVVVDSRYIPLITASPRLLSSFESH